MALASRLRAERRKPVVRYFSPEFVPLRGIFRGSNRPHKEFPAVMEFFNGLVAGFLCGFLLTCLLTKKGES